MRVTSLTDEQRAKFPEYVARWSAIGLCTDPADRPEAEKAVREMYAAANLEAPRVVWCLSPLGAALTKAVFFNINELVTAAARKLNPKDHPRDIVRALVDYAVTDQLSASVAESVWNSVDEPVWQQLVEQVITAKKEKQKMSKEALRQLRDNFIASADALRQEAIYGQHDAGWAAFYTYLRDECGLVEETEPLTGLLRLCRSANWALPYSKICWVSDRHNIVATDEAGRLHCENGPALAYRDGWSQWYIHGVAVTEQIIMSPETQTIAEIHADTNEERRRIRIERYTWERYLKDSGAEVVDQRHNDRDNQEEVLYVTSTGLKRFCVQDPTTTRKYALGVPRETLTCEEAQTWMSHGLDKLAIHRS